MIDPALLTQAESIQYAGFLLRQDSNRTIKPFAAAAMPIKKIARQMDRSRKLVRSVLRGADGNVFRCRTSILEPFLVRLMDEWDGGCRNGAVAGVVESRGGVVSGLFATSRDRR